MSSNHFINIRVAQARESVASIHEPKHDQNASLEVHIYEQTQRRKHADGGRCSELLGYGPQFL